jgi:stage V sporulation protein G
VEITEVRIKLMEEAGERLQAFCSITFDDAFVVRDLKIIEGSNGPFVAMPSRKLTSHCGNCGCKNYLRANYCNQCGARVQAPRETKEDDGRAKLYADIAHPINSACREMIQDRVIQAFREELEKSKAPDYVSSYDDWDHEDAPLPKGQRLGGRTQVQTAEAAPRGPHKPPSQQHGSAPPRGPHVPKSDQSQRPRGDSFGQGIF